MKKFIIRETVLLMKESDFEVHAITEDEAMEKYLDYSEEALEPARVNYRTPKYKEKSDVVVIKLEE